MITDFELITRLKPFYKAGKSICVTSDNYIIADDGQNINYINCENFNLIKTLNEENESVTCFAANPNDYTVITANSDLMITRIQRSNVRTRGKIWKSGHESPIFAMCLDKASSRLTTGGADSKVRITHIDGNDIKSYSCHHHKSKINIVKNHSLRNMVISVAMLEHEIVAWNTDNGRKLGIFEGHQKMITSVDFHESQEIMVSSSQDASILVWDCLTFTRLSLIPALESLESCIILPNFAADDIHLMVGGERGIMTLISVNKRCAIEKYSKASLFANTVHGESDKQDGLKTIRKLVPMTDGGIVVVRESDNIEFYTNKMTLKYELAGEMSTLKDLVMMGENRDLLLAVESAPYLRLFDCSQILTDESVKCTQWPSQLVAGGHSNEIMAVSVFGDGKMLVSGGKDGLVCVWRLDANDKRVPLKIVASLECENASVSSLCADKTGSKIYVNYCQPGNLTVLSFIDDKLTYLCDIYKPHNDLVSCMDITVDGALLATGSKDKLAKIWSYNKKKHTLINKGTLSGHRRGIWSVKFSLIERILLTASMDKTIKLWSLDTLECISQLQSDNVVYKAMFSKDEKQIISCDEKGLVTIWNPDKGKSSKIEVHNSSILAMNLLHDKDGNITGFIAAGDNSMVCIYKDVSKKMLEEAEKVKEENVQFQQEFNNLLAQKQFNSAFKLAMKLNKPVDAYNILYNIKRSVKEHVPPMSPIEMTKDSALAQVFNTLNKRELKTLMKFTIKWYSNNRTYLIGNETLMYLLCKLPNQELLDDDLFVNNLKTLQFYQDKYARRNDEAFEQTGFFHYLANKSSVKQLDEMKMDTN